MTFAFRAHADLPEVRITPRMVEVLRTMQSGALDDGEDELVYEKGAGWWLGLSRVGGVIAKGLLRACAIRAEDGNRMGEYERYTINETGRQILAKTATRLPEGRPNADPPSREAR